MNFKKWMLLLFALITVSSKAQVTLEKVKKDNDLRLSTLPYYNYGKELLPPIVYFN